MNILSIVEENAKKLNATIVHEIEMDIGELSGVDYDALEFAMQHTQKSELLENAKLVINRIPAKARCKSCNHEFDISDLYTACPKCNTFDHDIIQGKELKVKAIHID
ncbi:MAG: hydrogenase maturation nickel metallochaperone HypA [Bacteroidetes bacterium]|nr:hydrogenase maturation nickel metallochaperone HypA [Bacteroidota bacterium]